MEEIVPVVLGLLSGAFGGLLTVRRPLLPWLAASVCLGLLATVVTGEWRLSWAFLLLDIPLVAAVSAAAFLAVRRRRVGMLARRPGRAR